MLYEGKNIVELEKLYLEAKDKYYNSSNPIMTDYEFDELENTIKQINPTSKVLSKIGSDVKNGVKLPYNMMSLNKKKTDDEINKWKNKYSKSSVIFTDKLDGLSIIGIYDKGNIKLLTRGNGINGLDISKICKYIKHFPNDIQLDKMVIRGEIIMNKNIFEDKYKTKYANARNLVSGAILRKTIDKNIMKDINIVWYSVYYPENLIYTEQLKLLQNNGFENIVNYTVIDNTNIIDSQILTDYLTERKKYSKYEIDGIVVQSNNIINTSLKKNPENAFAFKMDGETRQVEVKHIKWNISKHNKLIPVVVIEPIKLSGVIISNITANNAKYIMDNKIGKGSIVEIIRSGEVIPKILYVIKGKFNINIDFPKNYKWKDAHHIETNSLEQNEEKNIKLLDDSFKKLGVDGLNIATITKMYKAGYNTIIKILNMKMEDYLKLEGFKELSAKKLYDNIQKSYNNAKFDTIMDFSNLLGEGIGIRNIKLILSNIPNIMELSKTLSKKEIKELLVNVKGIGIKKGEVIGNNLYKFQKFYEKLPQQQIKNNTTTTNIPTNNKYKNKNIVFSGVRDKNLENIITNSGGNVLNKITKNVDILVVKDKNATTSKIKEANKLNIKIVNYFDFV